MKNKKSYDTLDEIIFRNKNKEYGAYYLRKTYHKSMLPGILLSFLIPGLLLIYQAIYLVSNPNDELNELTSLYDASFLEQMKDLSYLQLLEPPIKVLDLKNDKLNEEQNLVPEIVDSLTKNVVEDFDKNTKDTIGIQSDTSSYVNDGFLDGTEFGNQPIYFQVDSLPEFPGGNIALIRFIVKNIKYPEQAIKNNICGMVYIKFCIKSDGSIDKVEVQQSVNPILDNEALRVVKSMPKWKPARLRNKNVNVWFSLPINFNLGNRSTT